MPARKRPVTAQLTFRKGFDPARLKWRGPLETVAMECSYCDAPFSDDDVPIRLWRSDSSAVALCDDCVKRWIVSFTPAT